jgi:hypothetical protein
MPSLNRGAVIGPKEVAVIANLGASQVTALLYYVTPGSDAYLVELASHP